MTINYNVAKIGSQLIFNSGNISHSGLFSATSGNFTSNLSISGIPIGEIIDDEVAALLVAGSGISLSYNDSANTLVVDLRLSNTDRLLGRSSAGSGIVEEIVCTSFGRSLIDDVDAAAARTTLDVQPTANPGFTGAATFANTGNVVPVTITNTGTSNCFVVNDESGDSTPFVIAAGGNVGIGTSGPISPLDLYNATSAQLRVRGDSLTQVVSSRYSEDTTSPSINLVKGRGTNAVPAIAVNGDILGELYFFGYNGTTIAAGAMIRGQTDGTISASGMPGRLVFLTTSTNSNALVARLTITNGGVMEIAGSGTAAAPIFVSTAGTTDTGIFFPAADTIAFSNAGTERVRVGSDGNVGVGTTSPTISSGAGLHLGGSTLRLGTARTPSSSTATGNTGEICWDASYLYICTATNTWRRIAHDTW